MEIHLRLVNMPINNTHPRKSFEAEVTDIDINMEEVYSNKMK